MGMYCFGIDVGGTSVKCGLFLTNGTLVEQWEIPTRLENNGSSILPDVADAIKTKLDERGITKDNVDGVGIGIPGPVNENGEVPMAVNLHWGFKAVASELSALTGLPAKAANDANIAALGEAWKGAAEGAKNVTLVTLGTGVGGGIIIDGKIFSGFNSAGAEIGHTVIVKGGRPCMCGRRGCWEKYASARALSEDTCKAMQQNKDNIMWSYVEGDLSRVNAKTAFDAMRAGDILAKEVVDTFLEYVACGIVNVINIFQPEILCIGGGISKEGDTLLKPLQALVDEEDFARTNAVRTKIVTAKLFNDAGIVGAACLGRQQAL